MGKSKLISESRSQFWLARRVGSGMFLEVSFQTAKIRGQRMETVFPEGAYTFATIEIMISLLKDSDINVNDYEAVQVGYVKTYREHKVQSLKSLLAKGNVK